MKSYSSRPSRRISQLSCRATSVQNASVSGRQARLSMPQPGAACAFIYRSRAAFAASISDSGFVTDVRAAMSSSKSA